MFSKRSVVSLIFTLLLASCSGGGGGGDAPPSEGGGAELPPERVNQGGATTFPDRTTLAFENPAPNLSAAELNRHFEGDTNFGAVFVSPPAAFNAGLGPLFNNSSCEGCHTKNGRGQPIFGTGARGSQAVMRISAEGGEPEAPGGPGIVPGLGTQFQDHAIFGFQSEGSVQLTYEFVQGNYTDGSRYELRRPRVSIILSDGSRLPSSVGTSFRTAPPIFGLGLLEAVPEDLILSHADPDDANGDGISGSPNYVWDTITQESALGRFGRKANRPTLLQQVAAAYVNDIGVLNPVFPGADGAAEIDGNVLTSVEFYTQSLAVPAAGNVNDPLVKQGEKLFLQFGCASCHIPELQTGSHPLPAISHQKIFAYTDLLLHDMGQGLADGRSDFLASGSEWRTTPLWGIGITATILSSTATYLHDGRARNLPEAILWHGGEAARARESFRTASFAEREALVAFLNSL